LMLEEKGNIKEYVFNTVIRFALCWETYQRMNRELVEKQINFDELHETQCYENIVQQQQQQQQQEKITSHLFSAMY
jgi:hypothetical protein